MLCCVYHSCCMMNYFPCFVKRIKMMAVSGRANHSMSNVSFHLFVDPSLSMLTWLNSFDSFQIGICLSIQGVSCLIYQGLLYPYVSRRLTASQMYKVASPRPTQWHVLHIGRFARCLLIGLGNHISAILYVLTNFIICC
jgi:hypothetical protein